jgi:hypothetical protein
MGKKGCENISTFPSLSKVYSKIFIIFEDSNHAIKFSNIFSPKTNEKKTQLHVIKFSKYCADMPENIPSVCLMLLGTLEKGFSQKENDI